MQEDATLLVAWRAGDQRAGKLLFQRYYDCISRFFRSKLERGHDDLVQEVFQACVAGSTRLRADGSFRAYLFSIAHNVLRGYFRTLHRFDESLDIGEDMTLADLTPGASTLQAQAEEQRQLLEALRRLPLNGQLIIELRYWESMSTLEVAEVLGVPHSTARSRLQRALKLLELELARVIASSARLRSTLDDLEGWARRLKAEASAEH